MSLYKTSTIVELNSIDELKKTAELLEPGYIACVYVLDDIWGVADIASDSAQIINMNMRHITYLYFIYKSNIDDRITDECIVFDRLKDGNIIGCNRNNLIRYLSELKEKMQL